MLTAPAIHQPQSQRHRNIASNRSNVSLITTRQHDTSIQNSAVNDLHGADLQVHCDLTNLNSPFYDHGKPQNDYELYFKQRSNDVTAKHQLR
jgi:hypothetical protein